MNQEREEEGQRAKGCRRGRFWAEVGYEDQCHPRAGSMPGGERR